MAAACAHIVSITVGRETELTRLSSWPEELASSSTNQPLCYAPCMRGTLRCAAVHAVAQQWRKAVLHSCVEEPGGNERGHEGVCAFRFLLDNLDNQNWSHVYFAHGDIYTPHHGWSRRALQKLVRQRGEWPEWPAAAADVHRGILSANYVAGSFGPRDFWHVPITWWLQTFVQYKDEKMAQQAAAWEQHASPGHAVWPLHNGTLRFPMSFMFSVDRRAALGRSARFYRAQYLLCKRGVRVLPGHSNGHAAPWTRMNPAERAINYNPLVWGHVNERLPIFLFGRDLVERHFEECLLDESVQHFEMNCSVAPQRRRKDDLKRKHLTPPWPSPSAACAAGDDSCGQVG